MYPLRLILLYQLLLLSIFFSETVKIGISKPLPISTTMPSTSTALETTAGETSTESLLSAISSTTVTVITTSTTSVKPTNPESEWPEFPPKKTSKTSNKTTTEMTFTTTEKASTTTTILVITNNATTTHKPEISKTSSPKWPTNQKYCFCDLTSTCDINCCCDHDCSLEALKVFRCLLETPNDLKATEERFEDFKFQHGLPSCEINDGWLCVFRTYKPQVKEEADYFLKDTSHYYKWPNLLLESEDINNREFYKFGDLIKLINIETKEIQTFDLPSSFESSFCRIQESIHHLKSTQRLCLISSYENLREAQLNLLELEEKYKIFKTPIIPDDLYYNKHLQQFLGNITIYKCYEKKSNCFRYNKQDNENTENYSFFKVKVNILHNFTHIQEAIVDLWYQDLKKEKYLTGAKQDYWLSYDIEFFSETFKEFSARRSKDFPKPPVISGPLGYLTGKSLIIARYEAFNKSQALSTTNQILNYFSVNNTESHTLPLLAKENGACKPWTSKREQINYGINVAKYCKIKLENDSLIKEKPSNINFTEVCLSLQEHIHDQLFGQDLIIKDLSSYFISQLGKPQNISNKWLELQVYNAHFDAVIGQYLPEANTFVCRNILLSLAYEFHIATFMVDNVPLQKVINHAALHLAERHDLEFSLNENLEVPVTMSVRFFNVHERALSASFSFKKFNLAFCIILELICFLY